MKRLILFAGLAAACTFATVSLAQKFFPPEQKITGNFFRLTVDLQYKGQPVRISYPVGCKANVSRQLDGDVSVDGTSISPFVFGQKMHDGGALVIDTPDFCSPVWASDSEKAEYRIPSDYNPTIIHFDDAEKPWFGMAYMEKVAYKSPHSVMEFISSRVDRISGEEWLEWRSRNPSANWVTWEKMGLNPNWFRNYKWNPGDKHMPTVCYFGRVLELQPQVSAAIRKYWPASKPYIWGHPEAENDLREILGHRSKNNVYDQTPNTPRISMYPSLSDVSMNELRPDGFIDARKIIDGDTLPYGGWPSQSVGPVVTLHDVQIRADLEGFAFCNGSHKIDQPTIERTFNSVGRAHKVNGTLIAGRYSNPRVSITTGAFLRDEARIGFGELRLFGNGGGL